MAQVDEIWKTRTYQTYIINIKATKDLVIVASFSMVRFMSPGWHHNDTIVVSIILITKYRWFCSNKFALLMEASDSVWYVCSTSTLQFGDHDNDSTASKLPRPWFNIMIVSYSYSKSHLWDRMILYDPLSPQWDFLYWQDDMVILNLALVYSITWTERKLYMSVWPQTCSLGYIHR